MTNGTSQGLFIVVAIVIFGIFVGMSYVVFGSEGLTNDLENLFTESLSQSNKDLNKGLKQVYFSDKEVDRFNDLYGGTDEFLQYGVDLSPIIEEHGLGYYLFEFEIKATKEGKATIYAQNGMSAEYNWDSVAFNVGTTYEKITTKVKVKRNGNDASEKSLLAFYSIYHSDVFPTVKNVKISKVLE